MSPQILLFACIFDLATSALKPKIRLQVVGVVVLLTVGTYWYFSPLAYAGVWTRSQCESAKWLHNWDFSWFVPLSSPTSSIADSPPPHHSADFHLTKAQYNPHAVATPHTTVPISSPIDVVAPGQNAFAEELPKAPKSDGPMAPPEEEQTVATGGEAEATMEREGREAVELPPAAEGTFVREEVEVPEEKEAVEEKEEKEVEVEKKEALRFADEDVEA